jgi:hypothetical protein
MGLDPTTMVSQTACSTSVDLSVVAENYGQMTGVLAGFAFTALVVVLAPRRRSTPGTDPVPLSLFVAFVILLVVTLLYSVLAGQDNDAAFARSASIELVNGLPFGIAVILLLHGITELMREAGIDRGTVRLARVVTVVVIPALTMYFLAEGTSDTSTARLRAAGSCALGGVPALGYVLTVVMVIVLAASFSPPGRRLAVWLAKGNATTGPIFALTLTVVAAMFSGDLNTRSPQFLFSPRWLTAYLVAVSIVLIILGTLFNTAGTSRDERESEDGRAG